MYSRTVVGTFWKRFRKNVTVNSASDVTFVQDNLSFSTKGTLRGLHYQYPHAQAKLVQVLQGEVLDVIVDVRRGSPTFGQWSGVGLSEEESSAVVRSRRICTRLLRVERQSRIFIQMQ